MRELSLFSGAGGGLLGTKLLGWEHVGYVEFNEYCQKVIRQRIKDGILDEAPIFGDIRTFISEGYAESYTGLVDVVTAGFPCQPQSRAGKQLSGDDDRDMWPQTIDTIRRIRPRFALLENVTGMFDTGYLNTILSDLAKIGYEWKYDCIPASDCGADHHRDRVWILAYPSRNGLEGAIQIGDSKKEGGGIKEGREAVRKINIFDRIRRHPQPPILGKYDAMAHWMDRLKAAGNGQVPAVVARAWQSLTSDIDL
jgi:DNA (cytosine-5)-methyltransferase 1